MIKRDNKIDKIIQTVKKVIDIILVLMLSFLSIKKGGFYKSDSLEFNLILTSIGTIYIVFDYVVNILKKYIRKKENTQCIYENKRRVDVIEILLLLLCFSYLLPIIFNNYSNLSDSIFEMIRYFNIYIIYVIVKKSDNKKLYINSILFLVFIQCLLGIDGLANRYFLPLLQKLNSGYLTSDNLTRMSATIQYANVFSLLCVLANVYVIDKFKNIKNIRFQNMLEYFLIFVFTSSIMLSKSRVILAIFVCYLIYILISKNTKNKFFIGFNILLSVIYTTLFMKLLLLNTNAVYLLTFLFYMLVIILFILHHKIIKVLDKVKDFMSKKIKSKKVMYIAILSLISIYAILAFCIKTPVKLDYDVNQNYVLRNIYNLEQDVLNKITIKIKKENEDSRYAIDIYEVNDKFESILVQTYNYYSTTTDTFNFEYIPKEDFENLMIKVTCQKDSIQVLEISLNNKNNYIDYLLLPTDMVYRTIDSLNGDSSFKGRWHFTKDSISLVKLSPKNFFIGLGGEGFKNTYELVKSNNYSSTEVHNVYLQILVESGIIGFGIFATLIVIALKNSKFDVVKLCLIIFCITSLFDLNFSYMFSMAIFAILLALLKQKDNKKVETENKEGVNTIDINKYKYINIFKFVKVLVAFGYGVFLTVILVKSNIAYYMEVPKLDSATSSFENIIDSVQKHEKRVALEPYETTYRYSLHLEYEKCFNVLKAYLEEVKDNTSEIFESTENVELLEIEYQKIVEDIEHNLLQMQKNDKYDDEVLIEVTNNVIEYIEELVDIKYALDKEAGYSYYLDIILQNIDYISNLKYNNEAKQSASTLWEKCYNKLIQINVANDSEVINKYINILEEKLE